MNGSRGMIVSFEVFRGDDKINASIVNQSVLYSQISGRFGFQEHDHGECQQQLVKIFLDKNEGLEWLDPLEQFYCGKDFTTLIHHSMTELGDSRPLISCTQVSRNLHGRTGFVRHEE